MPWCRLCPVFLQNPRGWSRTSDRRGESTFWPERRKSLLLLLLLLRESQLRCVLISCKCWRRLLLLLRRRRHATLIVGVTSLLRRRRVLSVVRRRCRRRRRRRWRHGRLWRAAELSREAFDLQAGGRPDERLQVAVGDPDLAVVHELEGNRSIEH